MEVQANDSIILKAVGKGAAGAARAASLFRDPTRSFEGTCIGTS